MALCGLAPSSRGLGGLPVRLCIGVCILAFVLIRGRRFDDLDLLAAHELRSGPLRAEHEGLVVARPAVQEVGDAVGRESVQLVVPAPAEDTICAPAAEERVVTGQSKSSPGVPLITAAMQLR